MLSWGRNQMDKKWGTCLKAGTILVTLLGGLGFQTTHAVADASGSSASTSDTDSAFNISGAPDIDQIGSGSVSGPAGAGSASAQSKAAVGYEDRFTSTPVLSLVPNFDFGADHKKSENHNDFDLINPKGTQRYLIVEDQHGFANWSVKVQNSSTGVFFKEVSNPEDISLKFSNLNCYYATKSKDSNNKDIYTIQDSPIQTLYAPPTDPATINGSKNPSNSAIIMKHDYSAKPANGGAHIYAVDFNGAGTNSSVKLHYKNDSQPNKKEIETATLTWTLQVTL